MDDDDKPSGIYLDNNKLISLLLAVIGFVGIVFCGVVWNDEQATQAALNAHIVYAAQQAALYVRKDDMGEINQRLQRIEDKLDRKADKP